MRFEPFWEVTQRRIIVSYRCFEKAYRSHLQGNEKFGEFVVTQASEMIFPLVESQSCLNVGPSALKKRETM